MKLRSFLLIGAALNMVQLSLFAIENDSFGVSYAEKMPQDSIVSDDRLSTNDESPKMFDIISAPPPSQYSQEKVNAAIKEEMNEVKQLNEFDDQEIYSPSAAQPENSVNSDAGFQESEPLQFKADKSKKAKITIDQIRELKAAGESKRQTRASKQQEEFVPFSEEELSGNNETPDLEADAIQETNTIIDDNSLNLEDDSSIAKKSTTSFSLEKNKKQKLSDADYEAIKTGGDAKQAVIDRLKKEGEEKRLSRAKAKQEGLQQEFFESDPQNEDEEAAIVTVKEDDPSAPIIAALFFDGTGAVDVQKTIDQGKVVNHKKIDSMPIVLGPEGEMTQHELSSGGPIILEGSIDGPEVNLDQAVKNTNVSYDANHTGTDQKLAKKEQGSSAGAENAG